MVEEEPGVAARDRGRPVDDLHLLRVGVRDDDVERWIVQRDDIRAVRCQTHRMGTPLATSAAGDEDYFAVASVGYALGFQVEGFDPKPAFGQLLFGDGGYRIGICHA